ncbi:substrate-binding domain-containing protein [Dactylosporangium salmoneum]|uniref:Phosphate ABC transporter substrate-binding protein PstS n=1 Tax=Dactylosporangium salmoneum TaxID=53361 RepID=A0ABP5TKC3_9ACTN
MRRSASATALSLLLTSVVTAAGGPAWGAAHARIEGTGSSMAANAMSQFVADVQQKGLQVVYTATGSAAGRKDFANQVNDFAISDLPFRGYDPRTGEDDSSRGRPFAYLPLVGSATTFPFHVVVDGALVRDLKLSGDTLARIFTNQITEWSDPRITADNGGRELPALPITPVLHAEGSGAGWQFTSYLADRFPALWGPFAGANAPTEYFPLRGNAISANGSDGVMHQIASVNGAIGYDEYSYALAVGYPVASVGNASGAFVAPTPQATSVSLTYAKVNNNPASPDYLTADLSRLYTATDPRVYPLASYVYTILPTGSGADERRLTTAKRQTLVDFFHYALCAGQTTIEHIGYAPLPPNLVAAGFDQLRRLHDADPAVDVSALASCDATGSGTGGGVPLDASDETAPYEGAVALQVAGGTAVHLRQLDPGTPAGHPVQGTDPTGHRHAWVFTGSLSGISVGDSRPGQPGWTLSGQSTDFVNGATTVSAAHFGWTPALVAAGSDAEGLPVAGPAIAPRMQVPDSLGLAGVSMLAGAPGGSGLGTQHVRADMVLWIPDTSPTGTYTGTLTLTLISG